jgi:multiple sugar transport system permease protein
MALTTGGGIAAEPQPPAAASAWRSLAGRRRAIAAYLFLAPYLALFAVFTLAPAAAGVAISFTNWDIMGTPTFIGLDNYRQIFADSLFQQALGNTFYFMLLTAVPLIALGLALAMLLNQRLRGRGLARTIVYLPQVVMVSAVGIIWVWMYDQNWGLINYYLGKLHIPSIGWLDDVNAAMPALALTTIWWTVGTNMVIYLAGLQDIPDELYEAARIDGASRWALFRHITLPLLQPVNAFVIPLTVIASWRVFGQSYVMTRGGPQGRTFVIAQYIYTTAFQNFEMGPAAAASVVLLLITLVFAVVQLRALRVL